jgi:hypothetical protein
VSGAVDRVVLHRSQDVETSLLKSEAHSACARE